MEAFLFGFVLLRHFFVLLFLSFDFQICILWVFLEREKGHKVGWDRQDGEDLGGVAEWGNKT